MPHSTIRRIRRRIDRLDRQIVALLNRRANLSLLIGQLKQGAGLPLFHRQREHEIARNVQRANRGPLSNRALRHLYDLLLRTTRAAVRRSLRKAPAPAAPRKGSR